MNARFDLDRKIARMNAGLAPEDTVREQAIQTGVARRDATYLQRWEAFAMQHSCGTCGEPIANTFDGGWVHDPDADAAIIADCADARGDDPIQPLMVDVHLTDRAGTDRIPYPVSGGEERHPWCTMTPCPRCDEASVVDEHGCCIHCGADRRTVCTFATHVDAVGRLVECGAPIVRVRDAVTAHVAAPTLPVNP